MEARRDRSRQGPAGPAGTPAGPAGHT